VRAPGNARAATSRCTVLAPPRRSASADAAAVAPVVSTSSINNTRAGMSAPARGSKTPRIAERRSWTSRRACGAVLMLRRSRPAAGRPMRAATPRARTFAWSYPRSESRRRDSGTQVTTSTTGGSSTTTIASARALPTPRHPENFSRWIARRAASSNLNAPLARSISAGGQSLHRSTGSFQGRPHRSHHGGRRGTSVARHASQNGHAPRPQPPHRRGKTTSSALPSTG
jgi:hypothetical protein